MNNKELSLEELQQCSGAGAVEWVFEKAEQTVAFYAGWAGAVAGGSGIAKGAYDAGKNAGIIE